MDVQKLALAFLFLGCLACSEKKTTDGVAAYKSKAPGDCDESQFVKTRFVVQFEDGHVEVIHAENETVFEKEFLEPRLQEIKRVEYDSLVTLNQPVITSDAVVADDWGAQTVKASKAWEQGVYGEGVTVAVIDTAVDVNHKQLATQLAWNQSEKAGASGVDDDSNGYIDDKFGWDFIADSPPRPINDDQLVHGTHVAGIILADPSQGPMSGIAPKAKLIPANFIDSQNGSIGAAIQAIQYATARGAKIINASWGGGECSLALKDVIAGAGEKGVLFVAASGNDSIDYDRNPIYSYPAVYNLRNQITVASIDPSGFLSSFSNRSYTLVHIGAPGAQIKSTVPLISDSSGYGVLSGTSMATPFVSGAAALLWSAKPNATVAQIKQALLGSTDFHSYKVSTQGLLNIEKALTEIRRIVP